MKMSTFRPKEAGLKFERDTWRRSCFFFLLYFAFLLLHSIPLNDYTIAYLTSFLKLKFLLEHLNMGISTDCVFRLYMCFSVEKFV